MLHRAIVVVDVARFTDPVRTAPHQLAIHVGLNDMLRSAFAEAGIDPAAYTIEDRGDGALILVSANVDKRRLADRLPNRLVAWLRRHNAVHSTEAAVKLRVALHAGEVQQDEYGAVSPAVNFAFRILEAPEAKSALASSAGALALIVSDAFYRDVISQDPAADPRSYQQISVSAEETSAMAWLRLPDRAAAADGGLHQNAPRRRTHPSAGVAIEVRKAVVETLVEAGLAEDVPDCSLLIRAISNYVTQPLSVPRHLVSRDLLTKLVDACAEVAGGMIAFARAVWMMRPGSPEYVRISQLIDEPRVLDLLPARELQRARELLIMITIPQLRTLVQRAADPGVPPAYAVANAWEAFCYLVELNAGADGFPPALTFVELVAQQLGGDTGATLMAWNDDQARRLRLEPELGKRRATDASPIPVDSRLHLMIVVEPDGIDPNRYLVSHWRQDDAAVWPPARGETRMVMFDQLERCVDDLVISAETAWSGHTGSAALEFVLPRALLNLPVHLWHKEHDSGDPLPLCLDYPIVVRSLERMRSSHWHRAWQRRWKVLLINPSAARVHFGQPTDTREPHRINAILTDPQVVLMVLTSAPLPQPQPGADELAAALRSGLPALLWHPEASSEILRGVVTWLLEGDGLGDLPGRAQVSRRAAFHASGAPFDVNIARKLVVLWDDPNRLVVLDQPQDQLQSPGDIADERGRAS